MKRFCIATILFTGLWGKALAEDSVSSYADTLLKQVQNSEYFTEHEKGFAKQLLNGASGDDSVLDAIMNSPVISDKQKEYAKSYFKEQKLPKRIVYKEEKFDKELEFVTPKLRFTGDVDARVRSIDTAHDVSNFFYLDNAGYDPGFSQIIRGQVRYNYDEIKKEDVWGTIDFRSQSLDGETDWFNIHIQNKQNWYEFGTTLSPYWSEFGLRNTELSGIVGHFEKNKWVIDFARGETVEDYVAALDSLSLGGLMVKRQLGNNGMDHVGLSFYDWSGTHYLGFDAQIMPMKGLRLSTEFMKRDSVFVGQDGNAFELEADYENRKILFRNEYQSLASRFNTVLNPEYANINGLFRKRINMENAFTYRFDPYITSSATHMSRVQKREDGRPDINLKDYSWVLSTQIPDKPKYTVVVKSQKRDDDGFSLDESRMIAMARTTFKARDIVTSVDYMISDFKDNITPAQSYDHHSLSVDFSRPFLNKLTVREKLTLQNQDYTDAAQSVESQSHMFEARYQFDDRTSIRGVQRYRRSSYKANANKYKFVYSVEAKRRIDLNTTYKMRLDSYNYNEFGKGYDGNLISFGADISF